MGILLAQSFFRLCVLLLEVLMEFCSMLLLQLESSDINGGRLVIEWLTDLKLSLRFVQSTRSLLVLVISFGGGFEGAFLLLVGFVETFVCLAEVLSRSFSSVMTSGADKENRQPFQLCFQPSRYYASPSGRS